MVGSLRAAGYVDTLRGAGGGLRLARPAETIRIGEVARRLESGYPLVECFRGDGGHCTFTSHCRLKRRLIAASEAFFHELDSMTLADCVPPAPPRRRNAAAPDAAERETAVVATVCGSAALSTGSASPGNPAPTLAEGRIGHASLFSGSCGRRNSATKS
ncbi:Rrf2 family transcriptional regulator [Amaricoccus sp.]|uniref:RrF2 family transcriptional regulator n=1 Tax=Amaricoccus sp. TaxID=1872485 RepID=UPI003457A07A